MTEILNWGVDVTRALQSFSSPVLDGVMRSLSWLGSEWFFVGMLPVIYWIVDERRGARLGFALFASAWINGRAKILVDQPRPYDLDPRVGLDWEPTGGFPSGHSQNSVVFWGMFASLPRRPLGLVLALAMPLLVGLSRVYLGVHFPTDVLGGWLLGAAIVLPWLAWGQAIEEWIAALELRWKLTGAALIALLMNALGPDETNLSGIFFGAAAGAALQFDRLGFDAATGRPGAKAARLALGYAILVALYVGGKALIPGEADANYALWRFVRYALLGLWVTYGAPELFVRAGLAGRHAEEATEGDE